MWMSVCMYVCVRKEFERMCEKVFTFYKKYDII